ncbi:hypothetical protein [Kitasatospora cineracea]|uniref:Uncharacterized protein n=1 Tax=Kitasatospora cineracea TaxID=88074 RepID=A0A3N4RQ71_9ACTN|nr:hypothetical protein [Kitasatospora cineracea]RPE33219.1 hypothetical protein EDD38_1498 [Kitasatospora cineracea]
MAFFRSGGRDSREQAQERTDRHTDSARGDSASGDYNGSRRQRSQAIRAAQNLPTSMPERDQPHDAENPHNSDRTSGRGEPLGDGITRY